MRLGALAVIKKISSEIYDGPALGGGKGRVVGVGVGGGLIYTQTGWMLTHRLSLGCSGALLSSLGYFGSRKKSLGFFSQVIFLLPPPAPTPFERNDLSAINNLN